MNSPLAASANANGVAKPNASESLNSIVVASFSASFTWYSTPSIFNVVPANSAGTVITASIV